MATDASTEPPRCRVLRIPDSVAERDLQKAVESVAAVLAAGEIVIVLCELGDEAWVKNRSDGRHENILASRQRLARIDDALRATAIAFDARVSRSATAGACAWAACQGRPIGVDVQSPPYVLDDDLLAMALNDDEYAWLLRQPHRAHAFAELWAAKEAVLKCFGAGLAWPPCKVPVLPQRHACEWQPVSIPALGHAWLSYPRIEGGAESIPIAVALNAGHG